LFNFTVQPAASVRAGFTAGGLPVELQIVVGALPTSPCSRPRLTSSGPLLGG
jgi:hypothetical protein